MKSAVLCLRASSRSGRRQPCGISNTVRNDLDGHAQLPFAEVAGLGVAGGVVAACQCQIAALIKSPREALFPALMRHRPGLEHAPGAYNSWNGALGCQHRKAVIMRKPNPVVVNDVDAAEALQ